VSVHTAGQATLDVARRLLRAGISFLPVALDGTKAPDWHLLPLEWDADRGKQVPKWEPLQARLPTQDEVRRWHRRPDPRGIGVVCGKVSGNLEVIDFDRDAGELFPAWRELVEDERPGLVARLTAVRTPRQPAGYHVWFRCPGVTTPGSDKLAVDPAVKGKDRTLIETKGEGGYALVAGCPAASHETGGLYELLSGPPLWEVAKVTPAERDVLLKAARLLTREVQKEKGGPWTQRASAGWELTPGADYDRRGPGLVPILERHGWARARELPGKTLWRRPGKERGWSATTGFCKGEDGTELLYVFTSSAHPLEEGKGYGPFRLLALLEHGGDFKGAAKALYEQGYGKKAAGEDNGRHRPGGEKPAPARLATTCLAGVRPRPLRWLVPDYLPLGKLVLFAGDGGHGKSVLTLALTAAVTTGKPAFGLGYQAPGPADVLLVSCEDDFEDTVVPRLIAAGADLGRCHRVDGTLSDDGEVGTFSFADFRALEAELERRPEVRLVVIDPAGAYIGRAGCDDHKDSELRALLGPLSEMANRRRVTVLIVKHINRNTNAKAVHRVTGSAGYVNTVRAAFLVTPDPDNDRRLCLPLKANLSSEARGFAFRPQPVASDEAEVILDAFPDLEGEDRLRLAAQLFRLEWLGAVDIDPDEALAAGHGREPGRVAQCAAWLEKFLGGHAWPSKEIDEAGRKAGFSIDNINKAKRWLKGHKDLWSTNKGRFQGAWWSGFGPPDSWTLRPRPSPHETHETHNNGGAGAQSCESCESHEVSTGGGAAPEIDDREVWPESDPWKVRARD
jgi:hypothetical protein